MAAGYKVSSLDDLDYWGYKETQTGRVRHELDHRIRSQLLAWPERRRPRHPRAR